MVTSSRFVGSHPDFEPMKLEQKSLRVEEKYDRVETKEMSLSTIHRYYLGKKLVAEIVVIYTDKTKRHIKLTERRI